MTVLLRLFALLSLLFTAGLAQAQSDYRIAVGDQLNIEVLEDNTLNRSVVVLPGGTISFPYAGTIRAAGLTPSEVQSRIASAISSVLATPPTVFVSVLPAPPDPAALLEAQEAELMNVYVMGEVSGPGIKQVPPGTTFLQALAQAGGLTRFAATGRIQLRRSASGTTQPTVTFINYKALMDGAVMNYDPVLAEGDVIVVPERRLFE